MPDSQFSEGQFEQDLLFDLKMQVGPLAPHFKPSQPLEKPLGFDLAVHSVHPRLVAPGLYASALQSRVPPKMRAILPAFYVTAFLQVKAPFYVSRRNKRTKKQWKAWGSPYYRLHLPDDQRGTLIDLEKALAGKALVRYAAPCFWEWSKVQAYMMAGTITDRTHFQSPGRIGAHSTYTYRGPLQRGIGFSEPEEIPTSSLSRDVRAALDRNAPGTLLQHVVQLWTATGRIREELGMWEIPAACFDAADLSVPQWGDLPLDVGPDQPGLGQLREQLGHDVTYRDYAALTFGIQYLAEELDMQVMTFWWDL